MEPDAGAEFRLRLQNLYGLVRRPAYRRLGAHAAQAGLALPTSTIGDLLNRQVNPRWETVEDSLEPAHDTQRSIGWTCQPRLIMSGPQNRRYVIDQWPEAGTVVPTGSTVDVTVANTTSICNPI